MISGVPLFRGRDNQDQLLHIMRIIGTPSPAQLQKMAKETVSIFIKQQRIPHPGNDHPARYSDEDISPIRQDAF